MGLSKAAVLRDHILAFYPTAEIDIRVVMFEADKADELLDGASLCSWWW